MSKETTDNLTPRSLSDETEYVEESQIHHQKMSFVSPRQLQTESEEIAFLQREVARLNNLIERPAFVTYRVLDGFLRSLQKELRKTDKEPQDSRRLWKEKVLQETILSIYNIIRFSALFDEMHDLTIPDETIQAEIDRSCDSYIRNLPFAPFKPEDD